ncbi:hypothetical protein T459_20096 [Capsicum annuum]|uniref:F-box/LRR-repeat protein 15/At3g58940/PEG3-like LRR domain-containing protein n=1 Tax=Capsicum annuum TaxID=4072 RepID=A0A2G2Z3P4_CAPAN|nr:hypothetical protein FXO37_10037 [Capsicum annuum]PHT76574.1 hypothetical protein T459_20096 [Capsicum annuum]
MKEKMQLVAIDHLITAVPLTCHMFIVRMTVHRFSSEILIKKWLDSALRSKSKVLHLSLKSTYGLHFNLLDIVFLSDALLSLKIHDCKITNCSFTLPNLRGIFVWDVHIEDDDLVDLIAGCPRIERLCFDDLVDLKL